jgi:hypothetical protein
MEISDLAPQFVQNYDRIIPETRGKGRSNVEILIILAKAVKFLDQSAAEFNEDFNHSFPCLRRESGFSANSSICAKPEAELWLDWSYSRQNPASGSSIRHEVERDL